LASVFENRRMGLTANLCVALGFVFAIYAVGQLIYVIIPIPTS